MMFLVSDQKIREMKSTIAEAITGKLKHIFVTQGLQEWIMTFDNGSQFIASDCITLME